MTTGAPVDDQVVTRLVRRVAAHRPRVLPAPSRGFQAATAIVLGGSEDPALVVIRRATHDGDPWSGQAALPGGKHDKDDEDLVATARRETLEEVGLEIGDPIGRLDDIGGRLHPGVVSPFVFALESPVPLRPNPAEVAGAHWVPVRILTDPAHRVRHPHRRIGPWPAWSWPTGMAPPLDDLVIWGLTQRILANFLAVTDLE